MIEVIPKEALQTAVLLIGFWCFILLDHPIWGRGITTILLVSVFAIIGYFSIWMLVGIFGILGMIMIDIELDRRKLLAKEKNPVP